MNKNMIAEGATMGATTHRHKEHAIAIAPFHSSFFESLHKEQWQEVRLGEVAYFQRGYDLPKTQMRKGIYPVAGSNGIIGYHDAATTKAPCITIGRSGNIGKPKFYNKDFWAHNTALFVKDFFGNNEKFIFYLLKTMDFSNLNSGSAVPTLNRNYIHNLEISLPPLKIQQQIAEILSSFDDKIDLLHRQNKTLESLALTLFRHTFINNPKNPNAPCHSMQACNCHSEPALAGEESIDIKSHRDISASPQYDKEKILIAGKNAPPNNEQHSGGATSVAHNEHWEMGQLGDYIEIFDNKRIPLSKLQRDKMKTGTLYPYYGAASIMDYVNDFIFDGAYILMGEDGTVETEDGYPILQYANGKFWINNHAHIFKAKQPYNDFFILNFLKQTNISNIVTGAVQPKINQENLKSIPFCKYPTELVTWFIKITNPYFDKINANKKQIQNLQSMRDMLLAKILNDKMEV